MILIIPSKSTQLIISLIIVHNYLETERVFDLKFVPNTSTYVDLSYILGHRE